MNKPSLGLLAVLVVSGVALAVACKSGSPRSETSESTDQPQATEADDGLPAPNAASSAAAPELPPGVSTLQVAPPGQLTREYMEKTKEAIQKTLNPDGLPPYSGPVGSVSGIVRVSGAASPSYEQELAKIPADECPEARQMYGALFREGPGRTLADALVSVTEYKGFVPPPEKPVKIDAKGCAWDTRTIALTLGQHIEVQSRDKRNYLPKILGSKSPATLAALAGGSPAQVFLPKSGLFALIDEAHGHSLATVFVLNYPTFDVTGLDGAFKITGVPAGKVRVTAFLPVITKTVTREIEVKTGQDTELELTIDFDAEEFEKQMAAPATVLSTKAAAAQSATPAPATSD